MRLIVVGAGGVGRELVRRLGPRWDVVLVDTDPARLEDAASVRDSERLVGDGSSVVVLGRAGLEHAAGLVAATGDDDVNLEAIRIALSAGVPRVVAVAGDAGRIEEYTALHVPVFSPHRLAARNVELELEPRRVASSAFAGGRAEAIEFYIAPDAAVAGKRLSELHARTWVIAAVLRGTQLIVPHGSTRLEPGDRVTVVGAAADYRAIVESFTAGVSTFPLRFGRRVAVAYTGEASGPVVAEAARLVRDTMAEALTVVVSPTAFGDTDEGADPTSVLGGLVGEVDFEVVTSAGSPGDELVQLAGSQSVGVIVVPRPDPASRGRRFRMARLLNTYGRAGKVPLLLARGTASYTEVLVPARRTASGDAAARAAIDLAGARGKELQGIAAVAPTFVATRTDTLEEALRAMAWLREEAAVHDVAVRRRVRRGNPVKVIADLTSPASLLVMGAPDPPVNALTLGITALVAGRVPASVLLVPTLS